MSLLRNVGSQFITFRVWNDTNDQGITGDAANLSCFIGIDGAAIAASTNTPTELSAANAPGIYQLELTQAETNGRSIIMTGTSTTGSAEIEHKEYHTFQWVYDTIDFDDWVRHVQAVLYGVAERTGTGTIFNRRDGITDDVTVTHDSIGNRTVSVLAG